MMHPLGQQRRRRSLGSGSSASSLRGTGRKCDNNRSNAAPAIASESFPNGGVGSGGGGASPTNISHTISSSGRKSTLLGGREAASSCAFTAIAALSVLICCASSPGGADAFVGGYAGRSEFQRRTAAQQQLQGAAASSASIVRSGVAFVPKSRLAARLALSSSTKLLAKSDGGGDEFDDDDDDDEGGGISEEEGGAVGGPDDEGEEEGEEYHDEVDEIYEDGDGEYEEEFEYEEEEEESDDYEEEEETPEEMVINEYVEDEYVPLQDDPDDPNYTAQKASIEENLPRLHAISTYKRLMKEQVETDGITDFWNKTLNDLFEEHLTEEEMKLAQDKAKELEITPADLDGVDFSNADQIDEAADEIDALGGGDAFPPDGPELDAIGITNDALVNIDESAKAYYTLKESLEDGTWEGYCQFDLLNETEELAKINVTDPELHGEMQLVLKEMNDDERPTYKADKLLVYDLQFDVSNLFLAACKHNPESPIILPQWLFQLEVYGRYAEGQDKNFEYTWEEAENADMAELESYWKGLGYDTIPTRTETDTNIVTVEPPDDDEVQMSHLQEWLKEVYDPEFDEVFFDDDDFMPYDSVYSTEYYDKPPPKDQVELQGLMDEFKDAIKAGNATEDEEKEAMQYMEGLVSLKNFTERIKYDSPEAADFQGHLVVACSATDDDLEIAETITSRFETEFGRKIFVETRAFGHAKPEDYLFEIWLESYDIDLLHSKRKATLSSQTWDGPPQCDEDQIDYLVDEVRYLISDEHRFSYRIFEYEGIEEG